MFWMLLFKNLSLILAFTFFRFFVSGIAQAFGPNLLTIFRTVQV